jgi:hypothetical protein
MTRLLACLLLAAAIGCGASTLGVMSDSIDAGRVALKATCTVETIRCEVARIRLNDFVAAYDLALAAQDTADAPPLEQAAADAMAAFLATLRTLHPAPVTSGGDDADGGSS